MAAAEAAVVSVRSVFIRGEALWARLTQLLASVSLQGAFLLVLTVATYMFIGHVDGRLGADERIHFVTPEAISGDEPHYLVAINSLIFDHDARIDEDHARIAAGGLEGGIRRKGWDSGGHSILINTATGARTLCSRKCAEREFSIVGGDPGDLIQVPAHPLAYPAFMALLSWPLQPARDQSESLVGEFGILISIAVVLLTYRAARQVGLQASAALASAMLLGFASSWLPYARSYFSESSIGLFLLLGFVALRSRALVLAGLAIGVATAMKAVFVLVGFAWIAERLWARRFKEAVWLTGSLGAAGVIQLCLNLAILRAPVTIGSGNWQSARGLQSFLDTLLQPAHGLLIFVPWAAVAFVWGLVALRNVKDEPGLVSADARRQLALPVLLCLAAFSIIGWGPGTCYGPRYWVPLLPFLAILAAEFAVAGKAWRTGLVGVLAAVSLLIAVPGAIKYRLLYSKPAAAALFQRPG